MLFECRFQLFILGSFRHFWQWRKYLLFREIDVFQGVVKQLIELLGFFGHPLSPFERIHFRRHAAQMLTDASKACSSRRLSGGADPCPLGAPALAHIFGGRRDPWQAPPVDPLLAQMAHEEGLAPS